MTKRHLWCPTKYVGSIKVSWKLPSYPSPNPTLTFASHLGQNVGLGWGRWAVFQKAKLILHVSQALYQSLHNKPLITLITSFSLKNEHTNIERNGNIFLQYIVHFVSLRCLNFAKTSTNSSAILILCRQSQ